MQGDFSRAKSRFNANNASFELTAGLTYHFMSSNGRHHFTNARPYDAMEVAELNDAVNGLRSQLNDKDMQLDNAMQQASNLQKELAVERVATYMKKHPEAKVIIKGYASPEGNLAFNEKLAKARAEAVKNILVRKYKIDDTRIASEGQGIGDMFSEPDWNRVSICTIEEGK